MSDRRARWEIRDEQSDRLDRRVVSVGGALEDVDADADVEDDDAG